MLRQVQGEASVTEWDVPLHKVVFTYNTAIQKMVGETPF